MKEKKDLINLNDELLNSTSLEELEERLELGCWTACGGSYNIQYCANPYDVYKAYGCGNPY